MGLQETGSFSPMVAVALVHVVDNTDRPAARAREQADGEPEGPTQHTEGQTEWGAGQEKGFLNLKLVYYEDMT